LMLTSKLLTKTDYQRNGIALKVSMINGTMIASVVERSPEITDNSVPLCR